MISPFDLTTLGIAAAIVAVVVLVVRKGRKKRSDDTAPDDGGFRPIPDQHQILHTTFCNAKWFTVLNLHPSHQHSDPGQGAIPGKRMWEFFDYMQARHMNCVTLKIAGYDWQRNQRWAKRIHNFMAEADKRGIWVQVSLTDFWGAAANGLGMVEGGDGARFNWWVWPTEAGRKAMQQYIHANVTFFKSWPLVFWELGNEMGHDGKGAFPRVATEILLPAIRSLDHRPIGVSENDLFSLPVDYGAFHHPPLQSGHKYLMMNEYASSDHWKHEMLLARPDDYINVARGVLDRGGFGVAACTWYDIRRNDWKSPQLNKVFTALGRMRT